MFEYVDMIRELREDKKLRQKDVAIYLGTTQQVYSSYETGEHELPIHHLAALAKLYDVSTDYILGLSRNPHLR